VESELVSGFMTEHSAVIFVFFFLAEYASIVLICILTSVLFLGGYLNLLPVDLILFFFNSILDIISIIYGYSYFYNTIGNTPDINVILLQYDFFYMEKEMFKAFLDTLIVSSAWSSLNLAIKTSALIFIFIWVRASFPRIRFDQLMSVCWTVLLPIVIAYIILIPCIIYGLGIIPTNISLLN